MVDLIDYILSFDTNVFLIALGIYFGFLLIMFLGSKFLPGISAKGEPLKDESRKEYKLTGLILFMIATFAAILVFVLNDTVSPKWNLTFIARAFIPLLIISNAFALIWSLVLFFTGRRKQGEGKRKGIKGILHDFWFGPELNPTWWGIDLKMFTYQPSLIGLSFINWSFLFMQLQELGTILPQMWMYQSFWWFYLFTHYILEEFMLSTWDVMAENFGFMLVWGDLVYVPFFYSICGWFIINQTDSYWTFMIPIVCILYFVSMWIFRGSNIQKFKFKRNPNTKIWFKPAKALEGKILISGFWGIGRKLNYTGEILVYFCIFLTTGVISPIPVILPASLLILLTHRAWRDEKRCKKKYGKIWEEYGEIAKFKMIPKIY